MLLKVCVTAIPLPIKLYVALRVDVAVILSQRPTSGTLEYSTNRFCGETYVLAGVLKSQVFNLCFGAKNFVLGKKLAKLRKEEDRWSQPAPTVGPTAPTVGPMQVSVHREIFHFSWRVAKSVLSSRVRRWNVKKKKEQRKRKTVAKGKEKIFRRPLEKEIDDCLHLVRRISHAVDVTVHVWSGLLVRDWTDNWSLNVCQSPVPWAGQRKWPSLSIQALRDDSLSVCSTETHPIDAVGRRTIFVLHFGRTQIRGARHWGGKSACMAFLWFENSFCQSKWSKKKASKGQSSSLCWIEESRKKKSSWVALEYTRTWVRSIKHRAAPAARSTGRRPPRDRGCEMTFETEARDRRGVAKFVSLNSIFFKIWFKCSEGITPAKGVRSVPNLYDCSDIVAQRVQVWHIWTLSWQSSLIFWKASRHSLGKSWVASSPWWW